MQILVTGAAGFIGYFLSRVLAEQNIDTYGIDSVNDYYDVSLKKSRLQSCGIQAAGYNQEVVSTFYPSYKFRQLNVCDRENLDKLFQTHAFGCVIHLAAQAGVRYSISHPETYIENNIAGFLNVLELCQKYQCSKLIYASSSSVYGNTSEIPFREDAWTDHPMSIYAATKKSNELMAYTYSSLYQMPTIGLRFFTVYGPYGRPDMAPMLFAQAIRKGEKIKIFNQGNLSRDFTYIRDIVEGIAKIALTPGIKRKDHAGVPAVVYNIGHGSPVHLMDFIELLEKNLGKTALKEFVGMQAGDVYQTWADTTKLQTDYGYTAATSLEEGIRHFTAWFKTFFP